MKAVSSLDHFKNDESSVKHGLPDFAYTSPDFRAVENETIFVNNWVFVGFAHQLSQVGDVQPITVAGKPLFLVRNANNEIGAFHNVCRHRCLKLIDEPKNTGKMIQCPYHYWAYNLLGELKATPFFGGHDIAPPKEFSLEENGLVSVRCETWHDWVFVNIDGKAQDFEVFLQPLKNQIGDLPINKVKPVATIDFGVVNTNWKLLMENFIEPYHVQFVHKTTTNQPLTDHYTISDLHCLGSACDIDETPGEDTATTLAVTSRYLTLFPNFVMGTYAPDQVGVHLNMPMGTGETKQSRVIYVHEDSALSADEVEKLKTLWYNVHKEDHAICERLQQGRLSDVSKMGGYLSPHWEVSVRQFQELVVDATSVHLQSAD
ncbi:MAG: Rieske 2Fe-2S domain-containing protein [Gammaproteobacteria bacterium]|nr:Rieske 2Fe-2S domain-containing protein [Gammaproteobacteria bacterium]